MGPETKQKKKGYFLVLVTTALYVSARVYTRALTRSSGKHSIGTWAVTDADNRHSYFLVFIFYYRIILVNTIVVITTRRQPYRGNVVYFDINNNKIQNIVFL